MPASYRLPAVHHEHSRWPQRSAALVVVLGLHVLAGAALLSMKLAAPPQEEAPVLSVEWIPTEKPVPPQPKPAEPRQEIKPQKQPPAPLPKPSVPPTPSPVAAPLVQAPAEAATALEAPKAPPAPPAPAPAAAKPAPAAQELAVAAPPADTNLKPEVDCTQSPEPTYPSASMKLAEEGTVMLRVQVDVSGRPLRVEVETSSKYSRLDRAARETIASSWVCPLRQGRQGYAGWLRVPVKFVLPNP